MNLAELQKKIIAVARKHPPSNEVPYGFEKRALARLRLQARATADEWGASIRALWCGAGVCTAIALAAGVWSFVPPAQEADAGGQFLQDLEQTIFAAADDSAVNW